MYLVTLIENWHGNKESFISLSMENVRIDLRSHLNNWDCDYSEDEFEAILAKGRGFANEQNKTCVEVTITKIEPGKTINE